MGMLTREDILKTALKTELIEVPEWGGSVVVREAMAADYDAYSQSLSTTVIDEEGDAQRTPNLGNASARLVVRCVFDNEGKRLFTDADAEALGQKSSAAVERVYRKIAAMSGMNRKAKAALAKN